MTPIAAEMRVTLDAMNELTRRAMEADFGREDHSSVLRDALRMIADLRKERERLERELQRLTAAEQERDEGRK